MFRLWRSWCVSFRAARSASEHRRRAGPDAAALAAAPGGLATCGIVLRPGAAVHAEVCVNAHFDGPGHCRREGFAGVDGARKTKSHPARAGWPLQPCGDYQTTRKSKWVRANPALSVANWIWATPPTPSLS